MEHARELQRRGLRVVPGRQRRGGLSIFSRRFLNLGLTSFSRWECTAARRSPRASRPHRHAHAAPSSSNCQTTSTVGNGHQVSGSSVLSSVTASTTSVSLCRWFLLLELTICSLLHPALVLAVVPARARLAVLMPRLSTQRLLKPTSTLLPLRWFSLCLEWRWFCNRLFH